MFGPDDRVDFSQVSVNLEDDDTCLLGNGGVFLEVPSIAVKVIEATHERSLREAREVLLDDTGVDVDVVDFVNTLDESGLFRSGPDAPNLWDRIEPRHVRWIFSRWLAVPYLLLVMAAIATLIVLADSRPRYGDLVWGSSTLGSLICFFVATWALVFLHELCHVVAARSLNVRARLSLGTRMQFLVAQTNVSGVWEIPRNHRYRIYFAGLVVDLAMAAVLVIIAGLIWPGATASHFVKTLLIIKLSQIAWQFLIATRTDMYFVVANLFGERNLLVDANKYLRERISGMMHGRTLTSPSVSRSVRGYAYVLILGRFGSAMFFLLYTVPITIVFCRRAIGELAGWSGPASADGMVTLAIIAFGWVLFSLVFVRQHSGGRSSVHQDGVAP